MKVYIETTIPSYLAARPSRDVVILAHQQLTTEWWTIAPIRFELFTSELVLAEIRVGDQATASRRLDFINTCKILSLNDDVEQLVEYYEKFLGLSGKARADIPHFAYAVSYEMDYLVTWNCSHIANGEVIRRLVMTNSQIGRLTPLIVTPEEILEPLKGDTYDR
ncbi:type II toxin-antitoxin system VapC family toxin [candidate division KSB1 bacterium]|nr:type II toxin-antitoxin system VapC family toxin [candidate division KSB1 bacterium]